MYSVSQHNRQHQQSLTNCYRKSQLGCPFPAPFIIPRNLGIAETDSRAPMNGATHGQVVVLTLSHGGGCWSVRHATHNDWWQALSTIVPLYKFTHHYNLDKSTTSCQSLACTHNIVSRCSVGEVHVISKSAAAACPGESTRKQWLITHEHQPSGRLGLRDHRASHLSLISSPADCRCISSSQARLPMQIAATATVSVTAVWLPRWLKSIKRTSVPLVR